MDTPERGGAKVTLPEFETFVASRPDRFAGVHPHSPADFRRFEQALGRPLPEALRWLLGTHGYSDGCGVDDLDAAVLRTVAWRDSEALPRDWLALNDWGDAGVVLLDLSSGRVWWCDAGGIDRLARGKPDPGGDRFEGYPEWAADRAENAD